MRELERPSRNKSAVAGFGQASQPALRRLPANRGPLRHTVGTNGSKGDHLHRSRINGLLINCRPMISTPPRNFGRTRWVVRSIGNIRELAAITACWKRRPTSSACRFSAWTTKAACTLISRPPTFRPKSQGSKNWVPRWTTQGTLVGYARADGPAFLHRSRTARELAEKRQSMGLTCDWRRYALPNSRHFNSASP